MIRSSYLRFYPLLRNEFRFLSTSVNFDKNTHSIRIRTCKKVYSEKKGPPAFVFKNCPPEGIDIDVKYYDSHPEASPSTPTVATLHGVPGNFHVFEGIISGLLPKGYRIIAPSFPDMSFTDKTGTFKHSLEEKAEFLTDWLKAINVNRIDVAIMHSSATFPTTKIWGENPKLIRSMVMMNPTGHRLVKSMKPEIFFKMLCKTNLHPIGRRIFKKIGKHLLRAAGTPVNLDDGGEGAVMAAVTMYLAKSHQLGSHFTKVKETSTPFCYLFSERDKLVEKEILHEMVGILGGNQDSINILNKEGKVIEEAKNSVRDTLRVFNMKEGGHYAFLASSDLLVKEIERLVNIIRLKE